MELTEEQKQFILGNWDKMGLLALTRKTFGDRNLNGRSQEAKLIQKFLGDKKPRKKSDPVPGITLTDSQKEYIKNSIRSLTPHEIGKILFDNQKLDILSKEVQVINAYVKELGKDIEVFPHEDYAEGEYRPPDQLSAVVTKVNKYLRKNLSLKTMPTIQQQTMEAIRNFIHAPRFLQSINSYMSEKTREMFEGEFIRTVFDKPDLTPDELNLAITLCQNYIQQVNLHRQLDMLNVRYEEILNDPEGKLSMSLSDMVKAKTAELEKCNKTQADLVKFLSGERSRRQEKQGSSQISVARLIEWFRDEEERKKALKRANLQAQEDEGEVKRLEEISETKARIMGISKSELLYG